MKQADQDMTAGSLYSTLTDSSDNPS